MVKEMSKATRRRFNIGEFHSKYFRGNGIDIGCGPDSLGNYSKFFPQIVEVRPWDKPDGDAQYMESVADETYDFVVSSHCLEHLVDPYESLRNWIRITKPGGYIVFTVPEEDLYEMGVFPSRFNRDHKHTFTIFKHESWCDKSVNVIDLLSEMHGIEIIKIERLEELYDWNMYHAQKDQTLNPTGPECSIEIILRKK